MKHPRLGLVALLCCVQTALQADPIPVSSTFLGGTGWDGIWAVATDAVCAVYVVGETSSTNFPHGQTFGQGSTFVAKLSPDGSRLLYSSIIGDVRGRGIAVDAAGSAYIVGPVGPNLPVPSTAQPAFGGETDLAILKLSPDGAGIVYATYLGGSGTDVGRAIAVDELGCAYVAGVTTSRDLPVTAGAAQTVYGGRKDGFVAKLNSSGSAFEFVSYLGGTNYDTANGLALDGQRRVFVTGQTRSASFNSTGALRAFGPPDVDDSSVPHGDAFVARLSASGSHLDYLSLIRGSGVEGGVDVALDAAGRAVVMGLTDSPDFPATPHAAGTTFYGGRDIFIARMAPEGDDLEFATFLGTGSWESLSFDFFTGYDIPFGTVALDAEGNVVTLISTWTAWWPGARGIGFEPGSATVVLKLRRDGDRLEWVRYLGGTEGSSILGLAVTPQGSIWAVGQEERPVLTPVFATTESALQPDFGGGGTDGFLVKLEEPNGAMANHTFVSRTLLSRSPGAGFFTTAGGTNDASGRSLWWAWTAPADGFLDLRVDATVTNIFKTSLFVYCGESLDSLVPVASNGQGATNRFRFPVAAGTTYSIAVGTEGSDAAEGLLSFEFSAAPNDDFANRLTIPSEIPVVVEGANLNATTELAERDLNNYPWIVGFGPSVWWEWTSPSNLTVSVVVTNSNFLALVQAYSGDSLSLDPQKQLRALTSTPAGEITFDADAGARYQLGVFGYYGEAGTIKLSIARASPPANDRFEGAAALVENTAAVPVSSRNATGDRGEPALFDSFNGLHSLWWRWTAPARGYARVAVSNGQWAPGIGVFTGSRVDQLQLLGKSVFTSTWGQESDVRFAATPGTTYYILVNDQLTSLGGPVDVTLQFVPYLIRPDTIKVLANGRIRFDVVGEPGQNYQIEVTTDFKAWTSAPAGAFTGPEFTFEGPIQAGSQQFFRIRPLP